VEVVFLFPNEMLKQRESNDSSGAKGRAPSCRRCWGRLEKHGQGNWQQRRGPNQGWLPLAFFWWLKALAAGEELGYSPFAFLTGPAILLPSPEQGPSAISL